MNITKAKLQQLILEEIERVEQEDLFLEELSELIDLQAKQLGIVLTEQEKKTYSQRVLKKLKKYGAGLGIGAALATGAGGIHSVQADYEQRLSDIAAANVADAEERMASPEHQAKEVRGQLSNQYAFTWTTSEDPNDRTPFPAVAIIDGQLKQTSLVGAMKSGASPVAVLPPEWSVLKRVLDDIEADQGPRVSIDNVPELSGSEDETTANSNRVNFFESEVWKAGDLKPAQAAAPYRGAVYIDYESMPNDYVMPLTGKTPSERYVELWDEYVGY
jgi:hypothetical protein